MLTENYEEFLRNMNGYLQTKSCPRLLQAAGLQILRVQNCKQVVDCNSRSFGSWKSGWWVDCHCPKVPASAGPAESLLGLERRHKELRILQLLNSVESNFAHCISASFWGKDYNLLVSNAFWSITPAPEDVKLHFGWRHNFKYHNFKAF